MRVKIGESGTRIIGERIRVSGTIMGTSVHMGMLMYIIMNRVNGMRIDIKNINISII
jgi:hypothetical protein